MAAKLTPWFPGDVKPARDGLYRCKRKCWRGPICTPYIRIELLRFSAGRWFYPFDTEDTHAGGLASVNAHHGDCWRGLASKPKA